jgi:uncharacterized protein (TIGR03435 family)
MIAYLTNHLWQSTLFAVIAGLATLAFRKNRAQVRYWLWFSASIKFFIPLALLMSLGSRFEWAPAANNTAAPAVSLAIEQVAEPFPEAVSFAPPATGNRDWIPAAVFAVWASGFAAIALIRLRGWIRIRAAVRASAPLEIPASVAVRASPGLLEPGVVGFLRPMLLVPEGIAERLTPRQLEAVLAHELCHVRRRDNLTSAIHMVVEAMFWFHPLVWWIGARLVEERERACDEGVLSLGSEPQVYAEAILNVCKLYVESPLACVSGVTGADLKKRIEAIMTNRMVLRLNFAKKVALGVAGIAALAVPIVVGMMNTPHLSAQSPPQVAAPVVPTPPAEAVPQIVPQVAPQITHEIAARQKPPSEPSVGPQPLDPKTYVIGPQDVLSIAVFHEPDLTKTEPVRADGKIGMPLVGDVQADGLTPVRLGEQLREALSRYVVNPDVTITVLAVNSKRQVVPNREQVAAPVQAPAQPTPVFEVASIKPCAPGETGGGRGSAGGRSGGGGPGGSGPSPDRLTMACQPLSNLMTQAYIMFANGNRGNAPRYTVIEGGPAWIKSDRYQVTAKAEGTPGQEMMRGPMLQALLEERFQLKIHRETREVPVYALTVAKGGPKLEEFDEATCRPLPMPPPKSPIPGPGEKPYCSMNWIDRKGPNTVVYSTGKSLDSIAGLLGNILDRPVFDKTWIAGKFVFHLEFLPDETSPGSIFTGRGGELVPAPAAPADPSGGASIFTAIQEQLGLKLEPAKGSREFIVIDRAEKPSEN